MKTRNSSLMTGISALALAVASVVAVDQLVSTTDALAAGTNGPIFFGQRDMSNFRNPQTKAMNEDGTTATVPAAFRASPTAPDFSPDGTKATWSEMGMSSEIKVGAPDGTNAITIASGQSLTNPQFSPDGSKVYLMDRNTSVIYELDPSTPNQTLSGKEVLTYTSATRLMQFDVSSTGKIAYLATDACVLGNQTSYGVMVRDLNATGVGTLVPDSCELTANFSYSISPNNVLWSSDGSKLYISQVRIDGNTYARSNLVIDEFTVSGKVSSTPFYTHPGTSMNIYAMALSPDGGKIVFYVVDLDNQNMSTPNGLFILNLATEVATELTALTLDAAQLSWAPVAAFPAPTTTAAPTTAAPTTAAVPATTAAPTTTASPTTTAPADVFANAVPGVTVTDTRTYQSVPRKVAGNSAIDVLTPAQNRVMDVVTKTPSVCLPSDDDLVFIDEGRCIAEVVNTKTRAVLRVLRTTVVKDKVSELKIGNEVAVLTPLYFVAGSFDFKPQSLARLGKLKNRITAAGSVLVAGHSGILLGNTPENIELARQRALATVKELRTRGAKGPFSIASVGALDPETTAQTQEAQDRNRRVIIVLIP